MQDHPDFASNSLHAAAAAYDELSSSSSSVESTTTTTTTSEEELPPLQSTPFRAPQFDYVTEEEERRYVLVIDRQASPWPIIRRALYCWIHSLANGTYLSVVVSGQRVPTLGWTRVTTDNRDGLVGRLPRRSSTTATAAAAAASSSNSNNNFAASILLAKQVTYFTVPHAHQQLLFLLLLTSRSCCCCGGPWHLDCGWFSFSVLTLQLQGGLAWPNCLSYSHRLVGYLGHFGAFI